MSRLKSLLVAVVLGTAFLYGVPSVRAGSDVQVGDRIVFEDGPGSTGGGEFHIRKYTGSTLGPRLFITFCVQVTENMDFSTGGFTVDGISDHTVLGNKPLKAETAFLYTRFREDALPGYDSITSDANSLQRAIWYLQGEPGVLWSNLDTYAKNLARLASDAVNVGAGLLGSHSWAPTDEWVGKGLGNVRIMNLLWATNRNGHKIGDNAQDQLVLVPLPSALVGGLVLLGAMGLRFVQRSRRTARMD